MTYEPEHGSHYDRTDKANTSKNGGVCDSSLVSDYNNTNPEIDGKGEVSTKKLIYNEEKAPRSKVAKRYRRRDSAAKGFASSSLTTTALKHHEENNASSNRDTESSIPEQKHRRRRFEDTSHDLGHHAPLPSCSTLERGDLAASKSSISTDIVSLPNVAMSAWRAPEAMKLEQKLDTLENAVENLALNYQDPIASDGNVSNVELSHSPPKHASVPDPSENPKAFPHRDEKTSDICEEADLAVDVSRRTSRTLYSIPKDESPVIIHTKKRRGSELSRGSTPPQYTSY